MSTDDIKQCSFREEEKRRLLAPGPETVDEEWQLSKDSADAATAVETEPGDQIR